MKTEGLVNFVRIVLTLGAVAGSLTGTSVRSATLLVYNNADGGPGSLRQVISDNNALGGGNTIIFSNVVTGTITLTSGELLISKNLDLIGPGANVLTVSGNHASRVFYVTNAATVSISGLTMSNGSVTNTSFPAGDGGGILNEHSTMTISNCIISGNSAIFGGGGIFNAGLVAGGSATLKLIASTVSGNSAGTGGGGIYNYGEFAVMTISNCTVSGNSTANTGGGIFNSAAGGSAALTVIASTISGNTSPGNAAGGIYNGGGTMEIGNTILNAVAPGTNIANFGTVTSRGYNLSSDESGVTFLTGVGDQNNIDPNLGPLQDNGGPVPTMIPLAGSPAIDQGKSFGLTTDQRGRPRPYDYPAIPNASAGDGTDIGAVEVVAQSLTVTNNNDSGAGSLRQAILNANQDQGDTITFTTNVTGTITLTSGQLLIASSLNILGPGPNALAVSGNNASRVFNIANGAVNISRLTIRDGLVSGATGNPGQSVLGGGIFCDQPATVTLTGCVVSNCAAIGGFGSSFNGANGTGHNGGNAFGGGVYNLGGLTLDQCWVVGNQATGGHGGHGGSFGGFGGNGGSSEGGGIYNFSPQYVTIRACTFSANLASFGGLGGGVSGNGTNGTAFGAGLFHYAGPLILVNSTVASNVVNGAGTGSFGGIYSGSGPPVAILSCTVIGNNGDSSGGGVGGGGNVTNTIIAGNSAGSSPDVGGIFTSGGFNIIGNTSGSTGFGATGDQLNVNPLIGPLQNNGGPTFTHAPVSNSPAIDKGRSFGLTSDQRGAPRPYDFSSTANASGGDGSDIGAFELGSPKLNIQKFSTDAVLSWQSYYGDFTLQSVTNAVASNSWATVAGTPVGVANQYVLTNGPISGNRFFRLKGN